MMDYKKHIENLRTQLHQYNHNYYVLNAPTISDFEFDALMAKLIELEKLHPDTYDANSPTQRVGSDISNEFIQVEHQRPMLSLGNTYNKDEVRTFYNRISENLGGEPFEICCEIKFDGLSISLIYDHGTLVKAVTRGDGIKGDDVTSNIRTIQSIPLQLPKGASYPTYFEIRGEVLMPWKSFEELNIERAKHEEALFANPRNAASGTLKSKCSSVVAKRKLDAFLYYLLGDKIPQDSHYANLQLAKSWGFKVSEAIKVVKSLKEIYDYIDFWDTERKKLPVASDGIVLKVNSIAQQIKLGYTAKTPRWAIAYKFQAEKARTKLLDVTYQVGRTGAITPVANMEPVLLSGTIVRRASLHNEDIMNSFDLHIGDYIYIEKAGEIIPQIVGIDKSSRSYENKNKVKFITNCPECGTPLIRIEGEATRYCPNEDKCPPQIKGKIEHYISRDAMNIDSLGPETIDDYYERGLIHDVADLYHLTVEDLWGDNGAKIRSAKKIIEGIQDSCNVGFERVLLALGIRFVGKVVAKSIAKSMLSIENIQAASIEQLMTIEGVGKVIAESVMQYFSKESNTALIERLAKAGVQMCIKNNTDLQTNLKLNGMVIVISGTFEKHSREEYKTLIENHGGKNVGSISKKTSFVLAGSGMGPSKKEKAKALGIPLMSEDDFIKKINLS